jgi:hypothetical protein
LHPLTPWQKENFYAAKSTGVERWGLMGFSERVITPGWGWGLTPWLKARNTGSYSPPRDLQLGAGVYMSWEQRF